MNIKLITLLVVITFLLSACVVRPAHKPMKVRVKPVKTIVVLDNEHQRKDIVVVNVKPAAKRHCWQHKQHWHCHR